MLPDLKDAVYKANLELARSGLVIMTFGNVSGIDRRKGIVAIKPSGVAYDALKADDIVLVDLEGQVVEGWLNPSSDTATHAEIYKAFPEVGGVAHAHSVYATMFAQARREIPCYGTTHADHFHGPVPLTRLLVEAEVAERLRAQHGQGHRRALRRARPARAPGSSRRRPRAVRLGPEPGRGGRDGGRPRAGGPDGPRRAGPRPAPHAPRPAHRRETLPPEARARTPITDRRRRTSHDQRPQGPARARRRQPRLLPGRALPQALAPGRRGVPQSGRRGHPRSRPSSRTRRTPSKPSRSCGRRGSTPSSSTSATSGPRARRPSWPRSSAGRSWSPRPPRSRARTSSTAGGTPSAGCSTPPTTWACESSGPTSPNIRSGHPRRSPG